MSPRSKQEYLRAIFQRYISASKVAKHQILTEVCATTGYHRKSAIRRLRQADTMKRAMAKQAETERERRAKVINAEGEYQAAGRLVEAATKMAAKPVALQLRFLQTLTEVATEHNSTVNFSSAVRQPFSDDVETSLES